ncbi:MAG: 23S rRNA (uracil(1939)-C(5))-methyltransferase RlmD [Clostridia bacterium]|nr:23S rRNA (uracil(1939)-C(5))-methyltransferase RlmD [Clostridia bacterium]
MELKKNDIYTSEITDYTIEGSGVCKIDGVAVFVPGACVGDKAEIRILKTAKNYAYGKLEKLIEASKDRTESDCIISGKCGGCTFRHISYEAELQFKQKRVTDALVRIGGVDSEIIEDIIGCEEPDHYRNKAQLPITVDKDGKIRVGFFAPRSHRVIPLDSCALQSKAFELATEVFLEWANSEKISVYDEKTHSGILRHLYLRHAKKTDELMVCIVANADKLRHEKRLVSMLTERLGNLKTVVLNINQEKTNVITGKKCRNLFGDGYITDELCGLKFRISPLSFYQVNRDQAERLYGIAADFADLKQGENLIDMYCGTGTIGLSMADRVGSLIGVEIIPQAIEDAKKNAADNKISNAEFICSNAAQAAKQLKDRGVCPDCIVLDPPRKGCGKELIEIVSEMLPKRIVYVSCDPATLARDIKLFEEKGFTSKKAVPVDMFPRTCHVETVVLMSAASRRSRNGKTEWEKYGEYFMNRSVSDIMSEYSEQHDEWH